MSAELLIFYALGGLALGSAIAMGLLVRRLAASALCLATTMLSLAGIYVLLEAQLVAAVQGMIYAGAIPLLLLSVILVGGLRDGSFGPPHSRQANRGVLVATAAVLIFGLVVSQIPSFAPFAPAPAGFGGFGQLGTLLFSEFSVPLVLVGALLLAAVVGAAVFAKGGAVE